MVRYATGDIHGGARTFHALLERLNLQPDDRLFLLGDYIDRGPDSKGVLDIILQLMKAGYDVRPVRGNHDDMLLQTVTGCHDEFSWYWMQGWGKETLKSFGLTDPERIPANYMTLLAQMPYLWLENDFVFVHAGLDMDADDPIEMSSPASMTWGINTTVDSRRLGGRRLVTGHNACPLSEIELSLQSSHILLDNGAFSYKTAGYGNLVALNLETMTLTLQPWLDGS